MLILPHPEVRRYYLNRAEDTDRLFMPEHKQLRVLGAIPSEHPRPGLTRAAGAACRAARRPPGDDLRGTRCDSSELR
jgi:hypothetical protein